MTQPREIHWMLAFLLALSLHLAGYLWMIDHGLGVLELAPEPARGGGTFGATGDSGDTVSGLIVSLGASKPRPEAPAVTAEAPRAEAPAQQPAAPEQPTEIAAALPEPVEEAAEQQAEPVAEPLPDPLPEAVPDTPVPDPAPAVTEPTAATVAARTPPTPRRKPKRPPAPELGLLEDRLPVQGPAQSEQAPRAETVTPQAKTEPAPAQPSQAADQVFELVQSPSEGRVGTAGLDTGSGRVPELNYKEKVILWLKRFGGYPRDAYRYRQEGVVLLHFAIDRRGRVLFYNIRKSSGFHLLDLAVKQMMDRASPVPPIPQEIQLAKMEFTVPVRFIRD